MCRRHRIPWSSASSARAASSSPSRTRRSSAPAARTFNEVFGRTRNPWNTSLTCGGSTGGGAAALATGEVWLAHGTDHGGSAAPARPPIARSSACGPSPGRVTRGTVQQSVRAAVGAGTDGAHRGRRGAVPRHHGGPLPARSDDLRRAAPCRSATRWRSPVAPKRVAFTADFGGKVPVDREMREICTKAARRFEELGASSRRRRPTSATSTRRSWRCAASTSWSIASCSSRRTATADQARHRLEHRARPEADPERDRLGRARARRALPAHGRVLRDLRSAGDAGRLDAGLRRQPAHARDDRRQEARELHGGLD